MAEEIERFFEQCKAKEMNVWRLRWENPAWEMERGADHFIRRANQPVLDSVSVWTWPNKIQLQPLEASINLVFFVGLVLYQTLKAKITE